MFLGSCLLFSASGTQKVVSLSSAEAEVYACSSGASDGILLRRLIGWLTGRRTWMFIYTDSSGAKGILQRQGVGRLRHLSCRVLGCRISLQVAPSFCVPSVATPILQT